MNTSRHINAFGALAAAVAAAASAATIATPQAQAAAHVATIRVVRTVLGTSTRTWTYGWPVKPFDRQHPVRAFLNDPRIGNHGGSAFHFGIDISVPDGTPVYAVEAGEVFSNSARAIAVAAPDRSHVFGYWHIVPVVKNHQIVRRRQLLGYVERGWEHVHFAERRRGVYVNPLRNGGLGPYADRTPPTVDSVEIEDDALVVDAHDTPDPQVPGDWAGEPVTPAVLRWRIAGSGWKTIVDGRSMLPATAFHRVFAPDTLQNHKGEPGRFGYYLLRGVAAHGLVAPFAVQVQVADTAGNTVTAVATIGADYEQ